MPASPLAAAMLGGDNSGLGAAFGIDPNLAQANSDIQLGSAMQQSGTNTSPAYLGTALGRLGQAIAGTYLKQSGMSDLGKALSGSVDAISKALPEDHPLQKFLHSDSPFAQMIGVQTAPKALLFASEYKDLNPGQISIPAGGGTKPGAENTGPQSEPGKKLRDALKLQESGQPAAANAITAGVNRERLTPGLNAVPPIPLNMPRVAPVQRPPTAPQPSIGLSPSAAIQPPSPTQMGAAKQQLAQKLNNANAAGVSAPSATGVQSLPEQEAKSKGLQKRAEDTAAADVEYGSFRSPPGPLQSGKGISEPLPTDHGTQIPPVNAQATVPRDPGVLKEKLPAWQKTITDWTQSIAPTQLALQRLSTIANAFKSIESGSFTTQKADLAAALKSVGLDASGILGDPSQAQLALHENYAETLSQLKAATSRFTQQEFKITSENKEHPNIQPAANLQMLSEDLGSLKQQTDLANDWNQASKIGWKDPQSFETEFLKLNKLPDYVARERQQIGPLKGMTQGAAAPSSHTAAEIHAEMKRRGLIQ